MSDNEYDVAIVGGGIAGLTSGLVSARAGRKTRVLTGGMLGGHLLSIERIDGYPSFPDGIPGFDLCPMVMEQATAAGAELAATEVKQLHAHDGRWHVTTGEGELWARAVVIATGTTLKALDVPGEARLRGKGVRHCATCDGPLLRKRVVGVVGVVGGGDSALKEALTLAQCASRVIILHRGGTLSVQTAYRERVTSKIEIRFNTIVEEMVGDTVLTGVRTRTLDGTTAELELAGLFVYVGLKPNTAWLDGALDLDLSGRIPIDGALRCHLTGLFAAGTIRSGSAGRAASAAGDGATAAVAADRYLTDGAWRES